MKGEQSIPGGCNNFITFLRREMPDMILGDNPAGHGFVLIEFFQISHNCVTECTLQAKFLKLF